MAPTPSRVNFVGFWPWPRVWATEKAGQLAAALPRHRSVHLNRALSAAEAAVFREVAVHHRGEDFEVQLCADGLLAYRNAKHETSINADWELVKKELWRGMPASSAAWAHYVAALNILFLLVESAMHIGRNHSLYWIEPLGRTGVVRLRYDSTMVCMAEVSYGPITELGMARVNGPESVGARVDGSYQPDVVAAFQDAMTIFDQAHADSELWGFLDVFASAWTLHALGHSDAAVMLAWSLIERDLVRRLAALLRIVAVGSVMTLEQGAATPTALSTAVEKTLRAKIQNGESPMAGKMLAVLAGHGHAVDQETQTAKRSRDRLAHGGSRASFSEAEAGLLAATRIARTAFNIELSPRLSDNPHLGLTP